MINILWYRNAVIYCLSVETFMDANGDGVGDFRGLMRRVDYLSSMGVTAIWLMPFQISRRRDGGCDISDYHKPTPVMANSAASRVTHQLSNRFRITPPDLPKCSKRRAFE